MEDDYDEDGYNSIGSEEEYQLYELEEDPQTDEGSSSTTGIDLGRYGHKKALAPYMTTPVNLRNFLSLAANALQNIEDSGLVSRLETTSKAAGAGTTEEPSTSEAPRNPPPKSLAFLKQIREDSKLIAMGVRQDDPKAREFRNDMAALKNRVKNAGPRCSTTDLSLEKCMERAPMLRTLKGRATEYTRANNNKSGKGIFAGSMYSKPYVHDLLVTTSTRSGNVVPLDLIITVVVYRGRQPIKACSNRNLQRLIVIYCLGSTTLDQLVKRIKCPADHPDLTDFPNILTYDCARTLQSEHFICIDNVFFTDASDDVTYSRAKHYRDSVAESGKDSAPELMDMNGYPLADIKMRLGAPYLYKHGLSGCEHFLVFSDVRLLHSDDEQDINKYPRVISTNKQKIPLCIMCHLAKSRWLVTRSQRFPCAYNYICDECNVLFNFDAAGNQVEPRAVITASGRDDPEDENGTDTIESDLMVASDYGDDFHD